MDTKPKKINYVLVGLIIVFVLTNAIIGLFMLLNVNQKIAVAKEASRPANLDLTIINDSSCQDCFDINLALDLLKKNNVKINQEKILDYKSDQARQLIADYKIDKVPMFIAEGELDKDAKAQEFFQNFGQIMDNKFIYRRVIPVYIETASQEKRGEVNLIKISDQTCTDCYDVDLHDNALANLGLTINDSHTFDINSLQGKNLLSEYDINLVPTIILQGDLSVYDNLASLWPQVGKVADDGSYIFTNLDVVGPYKNIETGEIITPQQQKQ